MDRCFASGRRGATERLRKDIGIDDHDDGTVAENGHPGEYCDVPQPRRHRFDDDLLGVKNIVDDGPENLTTGLSNDHEPVRGIAGPQSKRVFDIDKRQ